MRTSRWRTARGRTGTLTRLWILVAVVGIGIAVAIAALVGSLLILLRGLQ